MLLGKQKGSRFVFLKCSGLHPIPLFRDVRRRRKRRFST
jgi:hypothetical protein